MSTDHDLARITRWLEESRAALPPADPGRVLPGVVVRLPVTPQRGATWLRLPRPGVSLTWARAAAMAGLLLLLVLAMALIVVVGAQPAPAPRVGGLAYELGGDIYLADPDGTNPVLVADGDPEAPCGLFGGPVVSPDGRHLAYRSNWGNGCQGAITIVDPDGHIISTFPGEGWDISWSPDGTRVVTWSALTDGQVAIYGIDGVLQTVLDASNACCGDFDPWWSPDGAESVLIRGRDDSGSQIVQELPLDHSPRRIVPADDPRSRFYSARNISAVVSAGEPVRYSPDRTQAAFVDPSGLVVVDRDGTQQRVLVRGGIAEGPEWSPIGDRIAFLDGSSSRLSVADVTSGAVTTLASGTDMRTAGFSPDGEQILYMTTDANDVSNLWTANTDGSGTRLVVEGADSGAWLPVLSNPVPPSTP